jgi:hypothetical protein
MLIDTELIKKMEKAGYYFDVIESNGMLRFTYFGMTMPMYFESWEKVKDYITDITE